MMSDNAAPRCKQGDGIGLVSGTNISASQTPQMGQWMAHWMQSCRSSSSKDCQLHTAALAGNIVHQFKGHDSLALDRVKSSEFKLVRVEMNQRYSFGCKGKSSSAAEDVDSVSYALRSCETSEVNKGKSKITENSTMKRNVEPFNDETTFSEKVSTQHLTESSIKWKNSGSHCCHSIDVCESDFKHFPMFDINQKIETIMASKKESAYGAVSVNMKENLSLCESLSNLVELAPGSCLAAKNIIGDAEKVMTTYEGLLPDNADDMGGASSLVIHGCKYQKTNMVACMFKSGLTYLDPVNSKLACRQHKLCSCCFSPKSMTTGSKNNTDSISKGFRSSWTSLKDGSTHVLRESSLTDFPYSFATEGHVSEVKGDSSSMLLLNQKRLRKLDDSDVHHWPYKMQKCSTHDMSLPGSCRNLKSVESAKRFHKFSGTINYLIVADKMGKDQCLREWTMGNSAFTQVKGSAFPETITIPAKQNYGQKEMSTVPLGNFVSDEDKNNRDDTGAHLMGAYNEFSSKTETMYNHPFHKSSSLLGETFTGPQKGVASSNLRNSKFTSASPVREDASRNVGTVLAERGVEHLVSTDSPKETSVSSTESLAADHIVSHVKIADVSSSGPLPDHTSGSETCSRWVKRLQDNHSETLCAKRFKKGDASSSEIQQTLSRIQNYNPLSYGLLRFMKGQGNCGKATLSENVLPCGDSEESVQLWMRRWCHNDHEVSPITSRPGVPQAFLPENLGVPLEKFEDKMFASIGAMALMGKAMNNYRPCRFRRKEASLVWNT